MKTEEEIIAKLEEEQAEEYRVRVVLGGNTDEQQAFINALIWVLEEVEENN